MLFFKTMAVRHFGFLKFDFKKLSTVQFNVRQRAKVRGDRSYHWWSWDM